MAHPSALSPPTERPCGIVHPCWPNRSRAVSGVSEGEPSLWTVVSGGRWTRGSRGGMLRYGIAICTYTNAGLLWTPWRYISLGSHSHRIYDSDRRNRPISPMLIRRKEQTSGEQLGQSGEPGGSFILFPQQGPDRPVDMSRVLEICIDSLDSVDK